MKRRSDEFDSTIANFGIFIYAFLLTAALFVADLAFGKDYLDDIILGMLIGYSMGWIDKAIIYFFQRKSDRMNGREKDDY